MHSGRAAPPAAPRVGRRGRVGLPRRPFLASGGTVQRMAGSAAFFDLDRTLLRGASGPLIGEALVAAGLAPARQLPGQGLLYKVFDLVGETLPSMALARGAVL